MAAPVRIIGSDVEVGIVIPKAKEFTRPADTTAYSINDLIGPSTTAANVYPLEFDGAIKLPGKGGSGRVAGLIGYRSDTTAATIRYHFLRRRHRVTNGDNGALIFTQLEVDDYLGSMDIAYTGTDDIIGSGGGLVGQSASNPIDYTLLPGQDTIYVFLHALSAFTPGNAATYGCKPTFEPFS